MKAIEKHGGPSNRDDLLSHNYVRKLERDIRRSSYELDSDDAASVKIWVENHRSKVFYYQGSSDTDAFILGIQTEWQLQQMIRFGNHNLFCVGFKFWGLKNLSIQFILFLFLIQTKLQFP